MDGVIMAQCLVCTTGVLWLGLNWGVVMYNVIMTCYTNPCRLLKRFSNNANEPYIIT
jgi:hypothetical protein